MNARDMVQRLVQIAVFAVFFLSAQPVRAEGPALWHLADDDTDLYIFGSIHVLQPGTPWLDERLRNLVTSSDALYLELSAEDQSQAVMQPLVVKYGLLPAGDTLKNHLPADLYSELAGELKVLGMQEAQFAQFKPWMATTVYGAYKFIKLGFTPQDGVEAALIALATEHGVPVKGIETAEYQLSLFDNMSDETELSFLKQTLADRDRLVEVITQITDNWIVGDTASLSEIFMESFQEFPELENSLLTVRNENWVHSVENIMAQPGRYVLAVGTGHLVGEHSLIALLQQAGESVQRMD